MHSKEILKYINSFCDTVDLDMLFPDQFMREYSSLPSFRDFLNLIGIGRENKADVYSIQAARIDDVVSQYTEFGSWSEMEMTACDYFLATSVI